MNIKVDVFRDEEDRRSNLFSWHTFNLSINVPYPSPAVGDEFKKALINETRAEILKKLCEEDCSRESNNLSQDTETDGVARDSIPVNIACDTRDWNCKEKSFTATIVFWGRHAVQTYNNDDSMTLTDYSKPNEIFYLKGTIEQ